MKTEQEHKRCDREHDTQGREKQRSKPTFCDMTQILDKGENMVKVQETETKTQGTDLWNKGTDTETQSNRHREPK